MSTAAESCGRSGSAFGRMPVELWLNIIGRLNVCDTSALSRTCRDFHAKFTDEALAKHVRERTTADGNPTACLAELVMHATRHDAVGIVEWVTAKHGGILAIGGAMPLRGDLGRISFVELALAMDAPRVTGHLMKAGSFAHPSMKTLLFALAGQWETTDGVELQRQLDAALRLACKHALPRTARLLLAGGADANAEDVCGDAPIHVALRRRERPCKFENLWLHLREEGRRWRRGRLDIHMGANESEAAAKEQNRNHIMGQYYPALTPLVKATYWAEGDGWRCDGFSHMELVQDGHVFVSEPTRHERAWNKRIADTVAVLLDFGANAVAPAPGPKRAHACTPKCWRSPDCGDTYVAQTPLHLSATNNQPDAISHLISRGGAHHHTPNALGHTPLYSAMAQSQLDAAITLLFHYQPAETTNPTVTIPIPIPNTHNTNNTNPGQQQQQPDQGMTALHAACRFAFFPVVHALLDRGADPNARDAATGGRTPLHVLLAHDNDDPTREWDILATLAVLREAGADEGVVAPCEVRKGLGGGKGGKGVGGEERGDGGGGGYGGRYFGIYANTGRTGRKGAKNRKNSDEEDEWEGKGGKGETGRATVMMTPYELGRTHPLPRVANLFRPAPPNRAAEPLGPPIEHVRRELEEKKNGKQLMWGDEPSFVATSGAFPVLGSAPTGQGNGKWKENGVTGTPGTGTNGPHPGAGRSAGPGSGAGAQRAKKSFGAGNGNNNGRTNRTGNFSG